MNILEKSLSYELYNIYINESLRPLYDDESMLEDYAVLNQSLKWYNSVKGESFWSRTYDMLHINN